uniref:F-box/LRR-repeat protein n=1 Tax=Panagrellus redivivus TaxID=6233 RepID=A0A7E4UMQ1_PANRE
MPYPILQLPYGLQRRLRGLATPKERYNLQVAIGFDKNYLSPLQMHNNNPKYFENQLWNTSELLFITTDVDLHYGCTNDDLFVFERNLKIINFEEFDFDKPWFDHFVINCESFGIGGGIMNSACLKKLSKLCDSKRITDLSLRDCTPDVSLCLIFESFSNLETISLHSPNYESNWIQDILSCKKLDLIGLEIESRFEKLFCFEPHELSLLYKVS